MSCERPIYIHYGATQFDPTKGFPVRNSTYFSKPKGGLWASRKDASFGWKKWCEEECFRRCDDANSFKFIMKNNEKVYRIHNLDELKMLPHMKNLPAIYNGVIHYIDFEACLEDGYDAIELCWYGREFKCLTSGDLYFALYGWDCDSMIVLNPNAVMQIQK